MSARNSLTTRLKGSFSAQAAPLPFLAPLPSQTLPKPHPKQLQTDHLSRPVEKDLANAPFSQSCFRFWAQNTIQGAILTVRRKHVFTGHAK